LSTGMLAVVQARMGSTRLPGKVLLPLAGRTVLGRVVRAVAEVDRFDAVVVATTQEGADDEVVRECERLGVDWYRGPTDDVLARFTGALGEHPAAAVMRFTADCPYLDPAVARTAVDVFAACPGLDYLGTVLPRNLPRGMDVEVVASSALLDLGARLHGPADAHHRTHVTSYVYSHPDRYRVLGLTFPPDRSHLRVTLDTPQDYALLQALAEQFGDTTVPLVELAAWLDVHPEVTALNAEVEQKALEQG
jgi:spore coat polysaccharide biosynthesis protein SpsF